MASSVSICNQALSKLGIELINDLAESTKQAEQCNLIYAQCRDAVLQEHPWGFAFKQDELALLTTSYSGFTYAYAYPSDCLIALEIFDESGGFSGIYYDPDYDTYKTYGKIEFKTIINDNLNQKIILTDKENAELFYTAKVTDPNLYSPLFIDALSARIATELCLPLKGDAKLRQLFQREYLYQLGLAKTKSSNEKYSRPKIRSIFTDVR